MKLGLAVFWPAFWMTVPIKLVIGLLLLAAGMHPWDMPGLGFLLVLSIPLDIWAYGVAARTVFLERLRTQPPDGLGLTLWWQATLLIAIYGTLTYVAVGYAKEGATAVTAWIMEFLKAVPIAEKISIELVLWSVPTTLVLLLLLMIGLSLFGRMVRRQVAAGRPTDLTYQGLVRQWDLSRVPTDQPLLLTVFTLTGVALVLLLWGFMPVTTPHVHELYQKPDTKIAPPLKPIDALNRTDKLLAKAEETIKALEAKAAEEAKEPEKAKAKGGAKVPPLKPGATGPASMPAKTQVTAPAKTEAPKP
ncbi:MAG: hypothetical protein E8D45_06215 [Nitrospira sp.]|nr:MAG: hypothetical protein E8D45_06215 [Nitrospira sp.]